MVQPISTSEKRFRDGLGERYLRDDITIRCQAVSKTKLRKFRIEKGNMELTSDDAWPEGQCVRAANTGTFLCSLHGGKSVGIVKKNPTIAILPIDLQEKIQILMENPDYINREMQIWEILAMNAQLYERLGEVGGGEATFDDIFDCLVMIEGGQIMDGLRRIREILASEKAQREIRDEIRANMSLLKELTRTQVSTAKELRTMATTDQVMALTEGIVDDFITNVKDVVEDKKISDKLIDNFVRAVKLRLNARIAPKMESLEK